MFFLLVVDVLCTSDGCLFVLVRCDTLWIQTH